MVDWHKNRTPASQQPSRLCGLVCSELLYDDNLSNGESSTGVSPVLGSPNVSFSAALTNLADTQANGGTGEVSFSISDAAGRTVISVQLDNASSGQSLTCGLVPM